MLRRIWLVLVSYMLCIMTVMDIVILIACFIRMYNYRMFWIALTAPWIIVKWCTIYSFILFCHIWKGILRRMLQILVTFVLCIVAILNSGVTVCGCIILAAKSKILQALLQVSHKCETLFRYMYMYCYILQKIYPYHQFLSIYTSIIL